MWSDDFTLFKKSAEVEPSPYNILHYAQHLVLKNPKESFFKVKYIIDNFQWKSKALSTLFSKSLYLMKDYSFEEKQAIYDKYIFLKDHWFDYYRAYTFIQNNQINYGVGLIRSHLDNKKYGDQQDLVLEEINKICTKYKYIKNCKDFVFLIPNNLEN